MSLTPAAYPGLPEAVPEWQTISEAEQRQIVETINACLR